MRKYDVMLPDLFFGLLYVAMWGMWGFLAFLFYILTVSLIINSMEERRNIKTKRGKK